MDIVYKKPLVVWTIEAAKESRVCDQIVLLSNDKNVLGLSNTYNIEALHLKDDLISNNIYLKYLKNLPEKCIINKILLLSSLFPLRNREGNFATHNMNKISSIKIESSQDITIAEALFEWQNT